MASKLLGMVIFMAMVAAFAFALLMLRQVLGVASPWFGLVLMFIATGVVAMVRPIFLPRLPRFLREIRPWEAKGDVYRALGVPGFGTLLRRPPLRSFNTLVYLGNGQEPSMVIRQVEAAEVAHVAAGIVLLPYLVIAVRQRQVAALAVLLAFEVFFNAYPTMHLRWTRFRLDRIAAARRPPP